MNADRVNLFLETLAGAGSDLITECLTARTGGLTAAAPRTDGRPPMPAHNTLALAVARVVGAYNALAAAAPTGLIPAIDSPPVLDAIETQRFRAENAVRFTIEERGKSGLDPARGAVEDVRRRRIVTVESPDGRRVEVPPGESKLIDGTYVTNRTDPAPADAVAAPTSPGYYCGEDGAGGKVCAFHDPAAVVAPGELAGTPQAADAVFTDAPAPAPPLMPAAGDADGTGLGPFDGTYPIPADRGAAGYRSPKKEGRDEQ